MVKCHSLSTSQTLCLLADVGCALFENALPAVFWRRLVGKALQGCGRRELLLGPLVLQLV